MAINRSVIDEGAPGASSQNDFSDLQAARDVLTHGEIDLLTRMPYSSNATFLVRVSSGDLAVNGIYKPIKGERPLWDFPPGLHRREIAAYELSDELGWNVVPPTVERVGPHGTGSIQLFIDADFAQHHFTLVKNPIHHPDLRKLCVLDLLANNTDRKAGHEVVRVLETRVAHERDRIQDHSALGPLHPVDFRRLLLRPQILVDDPDAALARHLDGHHGRGWLQDARRLAVEVGDHGDLPRQRRAVLPCARQRRGHVRNEGCLEARQGYDDWPWCSVVGRRDVPRVPPQGQVPERSVRLRDVCLRSDRDQIRPRRLQRPQRPQGRSARLGCALPWPRLQGAQLDVTSE